MFYREKGCSFGLKSQVFYHKKGVFIWAKKSVFCHKKGDHFQTGEQGWVPLFPDSEGAGTQCESVWMLVLIYDLNELFE